MVYMMNGFAFAKKEFIGSGVKSGRRCFFEINLRRKCAYPLSKKGFLNFLKNIE